MTIVYDHGHDGRKGQSYLGGFYCVGHCNLFTGGIVVMNVEGGVRDVKEFNRCDGVEPMNAPGAEE